MLKNRALSAALLAALAGPAGTATAHAASAHAAGTPRTSPAAPEARGVRGPSIPAAGLGLLSRAVRQRHAAHDRPAGIMKSTNWAGYAVTGGTYTSVSANWIEPNVTCTSRGIVGFWVGLDGWGSTSVEQDGTGVDCENGTPRQFAWWETYPANSVQVYDAPVRAGDQMSSSIVSGGGGKYVMVLTDLTARWTIRNPVSLPGARDASAEIVAEAVTAGQNVTTLPDFGAIGFTGSSVDGGSLQAAGAQPIDMTDALNNIIATTTDMDPNGDFVVGYTGGLLSSAPVRPARRPAGTG